MSPLTSTFLRILKWSGRILSLAILLFGLPFYFGYGNPLPFAKSTYSLLDNIWLTIFPIMFVALGLGWKYAKISGFLLTVPIAIGLILGLALDGEWILPMLVPLFAGVLYLIVGYHK